MTVIDILDACEGPFRIWIAELVLMWPVPNIPDNWPYNQ